MAGDFPALGFDPAPGELGAIERLQERLGRVSTALSETRTTLDGVTRSSGLWEGEAAEAFQGTVGELPPYLDTAVSSMTSAANALRGWHADLAVMQRTARQLEAEAAEAKRELERAQSNPALPALGGLAPTVFLDGEAQRARAELEAAEQRYEEIKERAERLKDEHEDLAKETADKIKAAKDEAPEEPGLLDQAGDLLGAPLRLGDHVIDETSQFLEDNANVIANLSDVTADLSVFLGTAGDIAGFIPTPFTQALDVGLNGLALGLQSAALGGHLVAREAGADVDDFTIQADALGVGAGVIGVLPGPAGVGADAAVLGYQGGVEIGSDGETPTFFGDLADYWVPDNAAEVGPAIDDPVRFAYANAIEQGQQEDMQARLEEAKAGYE